MTEPADVGGPIGAVAVADGNLDDLQVQFGGSENKIEIAEGVEVAEV